jgi:hypothetical protein
MTQCDWMTQCRSVTSRRQLVYLIRIDTVINLQHLKYQFVRFSDATQKEIV